MQYIIISNIYLFLLAVVLAILEIQIEGKHGWAMNLPTWRPRKGSWFIKVYSNFINGKEVTGYHLSMFTFVLLILHLPYSFGQELNILNWSMTMSLFFIFIVLWDFLWFVMNPHYPLKKFNKQHISWHKKWWAKAPVDYYVSLLLSFIVLLPVILRYDIWEMSLWWLLHILFFSIQLILIIIFTLFVLKIDNWKK